MKRRSHRRGSHGFSLVLVLVIGMICSLMLSGIFSMLMPTYLRNTQAKARVLLRATSEAAIDWAMSQMTQQGGPNLLTDSGPNLNATSTTVVPAQSLPSGAAAAKVTVKTIAPPTYSYAYDSSVPANAYRLISATATAAAGGAAETIQVVLKPTTSSSFTTWNGAVNAGNGVSDSGLGIVTTVNSNTEMAFIKTEFNGKSVAKDAASNAVVYDPNSKTNSISAFYKNGGPGNNNASGGDVTVLGSGKNSSVSMSGQAAFQGNLNYSSATSLSSSGQASVSGTTTSGSPPSTLASAPLHPAGAQVLAPISLSGKATQTLNSGTYYINSNSSAINISGQASLNLNITNGPVVLYIEGNNPSINISGQGIGNPTMTASNFIIYYNGTGTINFSGQADLAAAIYAPNATFNLSGQGNLWGAITANTVSLSGQGSVIYDQALSSQKIMPTKVLNNYDLVSWQVVNGN